MSYIRYKAINAIVEKAKGELDSIHKPDDNTAKLKSAIGHTLDALHLLAEDMEIEEEIEWDREQAEH